MRSTRVRAVVSNALTLAAIVLVAALSTETPTRALEPDNTFIASEDPTSPAPLPTPNTCWDCPGSTMSKEEVHNLICTQEGLDRHTQMLDYCFPDRYAWTCEPDGTCEFRTPERDIDNRADVPTTPPTPNSTINTEPAPPTASPGTTLTP